MQQRVTWVGNASTWHCGHGSTGLTVCQENKISRRAALGDLQPIVVGQPFEVVGIDFTGPFPATPRGNKYVLTFTDHTIESTAEALLDFIARHGAPSTLLSDQGSQFMSGLIQQLCHRAFQRHSEGDVEKR